MNWLRKLLDPRGPLGEIVSPSETFKTRAGLPVATAHSQRVSSHTTADVQRALAPARVVPPDADVPKSRMKLINAFVEEHYAPIYAKTDSLDIAEILRASKTLLGWKVTQQARDPYCTCTNARFGEDGVHEQCGRVRMGLSDEQFIENIQSLSIQASDEFYNGFYETIPGKDTIMTAAGPATGGTRITLGRSEYQRKTKGFIHWDKGYLKERDKAYEAEQVAWKPGVRELAEKVSKMHLPRKMGEL